MQVVERYWFNDEKRVILSQFGSELREIYDAIAAVNAATCLTKESREKTMKGKLIYSPMALNKAILADTLYPKGWATQNPSPRAKTKWKQPRVTLPAYLSRNGRVSNTVLAADGLKNGLGLEVQFGKYAFLGWDILGKMPIFHQRGIFVAGVEVAPMANFTHEGGDRKMSTGIGNYEQIRAILDARGASNLDIPVLLLGIDATDEENAEFLEKRKQFDKTGAVQGVQLDSEDTDELDDEDADLDEP